MLLAVKPPAARRQANPPGHRLGPRRTEIVRLVYYGSHVVTAEPAPEPSPWGTGVNAQKGGPDLARARQLLA